MSEGERTGTWEVMSCGLHVGDDADLAEVERMGEVMELYKAEKVLLLLSLMLVVLVRCGLLWCRAGGTSGWPGWTRR